jgi:ribosome-associated protein
MTTTALAAMAAILLSGSLPVCSSFVPNINRAELRPCLHVPLVFTPTPSSENETPLCDLQTFLRLVDLVPTGGAAKMAIQAGECQLNGEVEARRAKKLFDGDAVTFGGVTLNVLEEVSKRDYAFKKKTKKVKPQPKVEADGTLEFGGRYRSEEWRKERKQNKEERKRNNKVQRED